ncbi:LexA family transcriptional regulator [Elizabethkingia anophelis]|uniref:LexA family transcriptional regulator n=1 Tax=Elizabethkingia anophelis TaxID=1117645 RepID=UPI0024051F97|nr:XRE family transcriptional regulator [Elizabethkingia anophelis]
MKEKERYNQNSCYLKNELKAKGITQKQMQDDLGVSQQYVSSILNNKTSIGKKMAKKLSELYGLDEAIILTGQTINLNNEEDKQHSSGKVSYDQDIGRPFYNTDWTLGLDKNDFEEYKYPEFNIDFKPANRDSIEWYRGRGQSMLGEIDSGDYIALEEILDFSWFPLGKIYGIITKNGFRTIKRIIKSDDKDNYLLVSNNPDKKSHPDQEIPKNMITRLFKIVYVIKDLDE